MITLPPFFVNTFLMSVTVRLKKTIGLPPDKPYLTNTFKNAKITYIKEMAI